MKVETYLDLSFIGPHTKIFKHNDQLYVPMRSIVENIGLSWPSQYKKLKKSFNNCIAEIVVPGNNGQSRRMLCLRLKKLLSWMMLINPNQVAADKKQSIINYQDECADFLFYYWTVPNFAHLVKSLN